MNMSRAWINASIIAGCAALWACERKAPPAPPSVDVPPTAETINGTERIGWDQRAADSADVVAIRYAIYVDNARSELTSPSCAQTSATGTFACAARLPTLTPGAHTLELASFVVDGTVLESTRSAPLRVVVTPGVTQDSQPPSIVSAWRDTVVTTGDGLRFRIELVADDVEYPVDIAFARDGRVFAAERDGRVRVLTGVSSSAAGAVERSIPRRSAGDRLVSGERLVALALDPQFERTHFVYAISLASTGGSPSFLLARFREASNTFGDRVVLLGGIRAGDSASAALRFGPDGALYAAFDDGGEPAEAADLASPHGKVLRLNADGSTPADQAGANPVYAFGYHSPRAIGWQSGSDIMWVAERRGTVAAVEANEASMDRKKRGVTRQQYALPARTEPSAIAFFRHDLLVASDTGRHLLRIRFDPQNPTTIVGTERLLQDRIGPIRAVGVGPDGAIYVGTDHAIGRLVPSPKEP
jgi:glucose/arabinose dehydrogenase